MVVKEFSTEWLKSIVDKATFEAVKVSDEVTLSNLIDSLERYIAHISKNAGNKGRGTSEKKAASSAANGAKGGRPKGSGNKPKVPVVSPAGIVAEVTKRWEEEL